MPLKDPEARRAYNAKRYRENKQLWKNPDGTWKQGDPARHRELARARYQERAEVREKLQAYRKAKAAERRRIGTCPICESEHVRLVWDHCHETGVHRGWICSSCNLALGHAKDSPKVLRNAALYLEMSDGRTTVRTDAE